MDKVCTIDDMIDDIIDCYAKNRSIRLKLVRFKERLIDYAYEIKWWLQRRIRGYSDCDVWNAGYIISDYAVKLLKAFREQCDINHPEPVKQFSERDWKETINEIIWGLERFDDTKDWVIDELLALQNEGKENAIKDWYRRRERSLDMFRYWLGYIWY